jgi:hypothetical protein
MSARRSSPSPPGFSLPDLASPITLPTLVAKLLPPCPEAYHRRGSERDHVDFPILLVAGLLVVENAYVKLIGRDDAP